eukprot:TRINITY_DN7552_c0_g1_i1.p1 TRINITY_DN7552_c0_g1~~TRINITY_DN7552_c0_g1_i1.p1  ORF type:complete len:216 (+),score=39.44 TRINITY_DN7552_c0_g1_i1:34-681(+)
MFFIFFFQAEDGIRDFCLSRGLGDVYKRQGVILYAMVTGKLPFDEPSYTSLFKKIRSADYKLPSNISPQLRDLFQSIFQTNVLRRIKFSQMRFHPWVGVNVRIQDFLGWNNMANQFILKKTINEPAFEKLLALTNINFNGLPQDEIKTAILKQQEYEFVILYQMLSDKFPQPIIEEEKLKNNLMFKVFWYKVQTALEEENYFQKRNYSIIIEFIK